MLVARQEPTTFTAVHSVMVLSATSAEYKSIMRCLLLLCLLLALALAVPSEYDLRVQSTIVKYADYDIYSEGICAGYAWAKQLAQVVSNAVSLNQMDRYALSAQQLLDCTQTIDDKCYKSTRANILKAMDRIAKLGLTTNDCYLNRPFQSPAAFCKRQCDDGFPFDFIFRANFKRYDSAAEIFHLFKQSDRIAAFAIVKVDDSFNFYSSFNTELSAQPKEFYEYRVAEIVGWKNSQKKITLRAGPGSLWGFNGYMDLDLQKHGQYVTDYYAVILNKSQLRTSTA